MTYSWSREALKQGLMAMKHSEPAPPPFISLFSIFSPTYYFLQKDKKPSKKHQRHFILSQRYMLKHHYFCEQRTSATS
jgi:hypothetical protein